MSEVKPGATTSEYAEAKSANTWAIVGLVLGLILTVGGAIAQSLGVDTTAGIIAGAVIGVASIAQKTLVSLGYIKGRSDVKAAASDD